MEASQATILKEPFQVPFPPKLPILGNLHQLSPEAPTQGMMKLTKQYGPEIMGIATPLGAVYVLSKFKYIKEVCDETRFRKNISKPLLELKGLGGDGLFTSWTSEPNWQKAHNILIPGLGQRAMKGYYPKMLDIAEHLLAKWHNIPKGKEFNLTDDMTRLTFDTIGLCGFDYRFHSFSSDQAHPFVAAMTDALDDAMKRMNLLEIQKKLRFRKNRRYQKNIDFMYQIVDELIHERKQNPAKYLNNTDLMSLMLNATDKATGEKLDDINIRFQIITFLIAGHETTSGLLSFAFYFLMNHPEVATKAYQEVDRVLGPDPSQKPSYRQVMELRYVQQILQESLRLWPTAPAFSLYALEDTSLDNGRIPIREKQPFIVLLPNLHRDPEVWGAEPEVFNPDHFTPEKVENRHPDAYKPFGNGQRACIGRQFAILEATLVMGMILQRYKLHLRPNYQFKIRETLTMKPENLMVSLEARKDSDRTFFSPEERESGTPIQVDTSIQKHDTALLVLYGSNMGASEDIATQIAQDGERFGFQTQTAALDEHVDDLPKHGLTILVAATYNGTPPDNAVKFEQWLQKDLPENQLQGVRFAVFGCGNTQWKTFQQFPRYLDQRLEELGAKRVYERGEADASMDFDEDFENWYQGFWQAIRAEFKISRAEAVTQHEARYQVEWIDHTSYQPVLPPNRNGEQKMEVLVNRELHQKTGNHPSPRSTRHIELKLPEGLTYRTGDHLGIYPQNSQALLERVYQRFQLQPAKLLKIGQTSQIKSSLPLHQVISLEDLLKYFVELQEPISRKQIQILANYTDCPPEKIKLQTYLGEDIASQQRFKEEIQAKKLSVLDLLEEFLACEVPFAVYLEMLPPMKPRYFSISSSPLANPEVCSITAGVLNEPAFSGKGTFQGVCTNYLAEQPTGSSVLAYVQNVQSPFRLPEDHTQPIIMIGPGTGLAPFRGFLQERMALKNQGETVGESLLFFGCRHPEQDYIYEEALKGFEVAKVTRLFTAFSRWGERKVYVQHLIAEQQALVWEFLEKGAVVYVCGDSAQMAPDVARTFCELYQARHQTSPEEAQQWLERMKTEQKYLEDIWV